MQIQSTIIGGDISMEPEETKYCCIHANKTNKNCNCMGIIMCILTGLFLATIGLILGAVFATTLMANLAVLILGAVILGLLTILALIYKLCICAKKKCC